MILTMLAAGLALCGQPTTPATPAAAPKVESLRYFEVPLKGEVGKEITAPGVKEAIKAALLKKADCVVFVIETPGGRVIDADAIADVMDHERAGLKFYAVIRRAISAGIWPLSRMDGIFFAPGGAAGAAVAFKYSSNTGQFEVDAKFNAAHAADVSAAAELHGQPGCVYRAMMVQNATLFRWRGEDGKVKLGETAPPGAKEVVELDNSSSVLAWTTQQAVETGFGTMMKSGEVSSLGPLLQVKEWVSVGDGTPQMTRFKNEIERAVNDVKRTQDQIETTRKAIVTAAERVVSQAAIARKADPRNIQVFYRDTGTFTPESQTKWRQASDAAIDAWNAVLGLLEDLQRAERKAALAVDEYNKAVNKEFAARLYKDKPEPLKLDPVDHGINEPLARKEASDILARVRTERSKNRV